MISALLLSPALAFAALAPDACGPKGECGPGLGCSAGVCKDIETDVVAYASYCKHELGFAHPEAKLPYLSCYDSGDMRGGPRSPTGRQVDVKLTVAGGTMHLKDAEHVWDQVFGAGGCDDPNYLYGYCDPYYRLNVWKPDAGGNESIVAALHCRNDSDEKPSPYAVLAADRLKAYTDAAGASSSERTRLFDQWNGTSEIVLILANTDSGKACFFHAARPYWGSHVPAPDDERDIATPAARAALWAELPVKPPFGPEQRQDQWLRNAQNGYYSPDYMVCTGCHDSGPFLHDPFIDSMNDGSQFFLPQDKRTRPYLPLGYQAHVGYTYIKTDPVKMGDGTTQPQRCTSCHSMGSEHACSSWFDRAVGWDFPSEASTESRSTQSLARYMAPHNATTRDEFYKDLGPHIDAMKCCCEHPGWNGCRTVPRATPAAAGISGTDSRSCVASASGGWHQPCAADSECNHSGLTCNAGSCKFPDEF